MMLKPKHPPRSAEYTRTRGKAGCSAWYYEHLEVPTVGVQLRNGQASVGSITEKETIVRIEKAFRTESTAYSGFRNDRVDPYGGRR